MKATAKHNVNYNGVWYKVGDVLDVADADKYEMAAYFDFKDEYVPFARTEEVPRVEETTLGETPKRGRRRKSEE